MSSTNGGSASAALFFFFVFFLACTALALLNVYPGDVHQNTAEIYMWSTLGFELIYSRHPPLLPWIVGALNHLVTVNYVVLAALAAFNVTLAAYAVWRIACLTVGEARAVLVVAIYWLSPYTVWHAMKFDHNAILLSTWPLVVWAFLLSLRDPKWWRGLILGLASAAAIYAKYTSGLLLVAVAVAAIVSPRRATYFRTSAPYVALTTLILLVAPLAWAAYRDQLSTVHVALNQVVPIGSLPIYMLATNLLRLLPVLAGFALLYYWIGPRQRESTQHLRELLILVLLSYALIVGASVALGLRGSQAWPMPVFALVPLLLVSLLRTPNATQLAVLYRASPYLLCLIPVVGVIMLVTGFRQANHNIVEPTQELAREAASIWGRAIHRPVGIVAGDGFIDFSASLALPDHPRAWQAFGSQWWITPELIDQLGVLAFCREADTNKDKDCNATSSKLVRERNGWTCQIEARRSLWGMTGPLLRVHAYFVPPKMVEAEQLCTP
jgi:4-amino-4-deoxy-L-arabinose transferase-like glycosyltransferase